MTSKTIALAAATFAAVIGLGVAAAETKLPSVAQPKPSEGRTLTHANGYSITVPNDWLVATDAKGVDFMMATPDMSVICQTFSEKDIITAEDADVKAMLSTENLGEELFTKLLMGEAPGLTYLSTGPQPDHPSGWPFQRAVANAELDSKPMTSMLYLTFKSKNAYFGGCYTEQAAYEANKTKMDDVINAIRLN